MAAVLAPERSTQRIQWLGLECVVPVDWEIVQHGHAPAAGRLVFVDRRRERLVLSWAACRSEPDLERLVSDFVAAEGTQARRIRIGRWRGIERSEPSGGRRTQVVLYDAPSARLIEVQISGAATNADQHTTREILDRLVVREPVGECRSWRAFGLALRTPVGFSLIEAQVRPADVRLRFSRSGAALAAEAEVRRLGMARAWFDGDLRGLLVKHLGPSALEHAESYAHHGQPAACGEAWEKVARFQRWFGRARRRRGLAFAVSSENAVYLVTTLSPVAEPLEPRAFELGSASFELGSAGFELGSAGFELGSAGEVE